MIYYNINEMDDFKVLIAQRNYRICAIILGQSREQLLNELAGYFNDEIFQEREQNLMDIKVMEQFLNPSKNEMLSIPLEMNGTDLQKEIWIFLRNTEVGETFTYKEIAKKIGKGEKSSRMIANACAANRFALIVPCHRVLSSNGKYSGYKWGKDLKELILLKEKIIAQKM